MSYAVWPSALTWRGAVRWDSTDTTWADDGTLRHGRGDGRLERRAACRERIRVEDDDERRRGQVQVRDQQGARLGRLERIEGEAAGPQRAAGPRRERQREEQQQAPGEDHRAAMPVDERPESLEPAHRTAHRDAGGRDGSVASSGGGSPSAGPC